MRIMFEKAVSFCVLTAFCLSLCGCSGGLSSKRTSNLLGTEIIIGGVVGAAAGGLAGSNDAGVALAVAGGLVGVFIGALLEKQAALPPRVSRPLGPEGARPVQKGEYRRDSEGTIPPSGVFVAPATGSEGSGDSGTGVGTVIDLQTVFRPAKQDTPASLAAEGPPGAAKSPAPERGAVSKDDRRPEERIADSTIIPLPRKDSDASGIEFANEPSGEVIPMPEAKPEPPSDASGDSDDRTSSIRAFVDRLFNFQGFIVSSPALEDIFFEFESDALTPHAVETLQRNMRTLMDYPGINVQIEGFVGQHENIEFILGIELGKRRAQIIRDYLILSGVPPGRITTKSFGRTMPLLQETGLEGDQASLAARLNRRVHFEIDISQGSPGVMRLFE